MSEAAPQSTPEKLQIDKDFYFRFSDEDKKAMHSGVWEYKNPVWILNKWKDQLEATADTILSEEGIEAKHSALWLWYHHASQFAYRDGDTETALAFINKALEYHEKGSPENRITPLLKMLYQGDFEQARSFAETIPARVMEPRPGGTFEEIDNPEKETANYLINEYLKDVESKK